jgi:SNF2 family DNA or RNA helicase
MESERRALMKHQRQMKQFARSHTHRVGFFCAPGTGKTMPSIQLALEKPPPYLVLCRRDDYLTWRLELQMEGVPESDMFGIESGTDVDGHEGPLPWVFCTWDLLRNVNVQNWIKSIEWQVVIGDELHSIKRWQAERTKQAVRCTRHIPYRLGLTGSPVTNELRDVWSQCLFIDDGKTFGNNEWQFLKKYYIGDTMTGGWFIQRGAADKIKKQLQSIAYAVHEDDVLKLPPLKHVLKAAPMSGMQRRLYDSVLEAWELELLSDNKIIEYNQVVVQLAKLKQIASGFVYDDTGMARRLRCPKLELLTSMAKDDDYLGTKPKFIVWCSQTDEIRRIAETFDNIGIPHVMFFGEMKPEHRHESRQTFAGTNNIRAFIAQVDAGVGMNELIVADTAIYYSNSLKVVSRQQSMRRNRRKGSEIHKQITYYDLVTEDTVDVKIARNIDKSMSIAHYVVHGLKKGKSLRELI